MLTTTILLACAASHDEPIKLVEFSADNSYDAGSGRTVHAARGLLKSGEAEAMKSAIESMAANVSKLDSTDGLPAYEMYIRHEGKDTHSSAEAALHMGLEQRIADFTRETYGCSECFICSVLLRRYRGAERMKVLSHFDRLAYITAVASLNPADFTGGLFLQRTPNASSREYFKVGAEDVVFHQYNLNHGVEILSGERYSAVFWITDTRASCEEDVSPWYQQAAEAGDADAQDALGELHALGQHGYERNMHIAKEWSTKAAEQGHAMAQSRLGRLYLAGEGGVTRDVEQGIRWVRAAAQQGYPPAHHTMGLVCQDGLAEGGLAEAARWFGLAAEAGIAASQYEIGVAYVNGDGVEVDLAKGVDWLWKSSQQGNADAKRDLKQLEEAGVFKWGEVEEEEEAGNKAEDERVKDEV